MAESYSVEAVLTAKDQNFSSTFKNATNSTSKFKKLAGVGLATVAKVGAAAVAGVAGGMSVFGVKSIQAGRDFDSSMSQVAATMGTTVDKIGNLRDFAQEMGRTTAFSATQSADALNYMALAGYDAETSMKMLPNVLNLAAAGGIELAQASDMVTDAQSAFGLTTEQTTAMVDQMARTSSKTNTSVQQLGEGFLKIGATARNLKGGTQELATMLGVLADNGIKGAEGGTHFRNILLSLQNPTEAGAKALQNLGVQVYDSSGKMRSTIDIFKDMQNSMKGMSDESKQAMLSGMFNKTDLAAVNALLNTSGERFDELTASIGDCEGAAKKMADTQLDNLEGDVTLFKSALEGAQIALSDGLNPALRFLTQSGTKGLEKLTGVFEKLNTYMTAGVKGFKSVKGVGTAVKEAFSALAKELFNVNSAFGSKDSVKSFGDACKAAAEKIKSMANWLKEHAAQVAAVIEALPKLIAAFAGLSIISKFAPALKTVSGAFGKIAASVGGKIAGKLTSVGKGIESTGKKASVSNAKLLASAKALALMGLAVLEIAVAFAILAQSAIALAGAGGAAIATFFGMVVAVGALMAVMVALTKSMATISPAKLTQISVAFLAMGAAVLLVAAGFALLAFSAISLANAGTAAIVTFFGMVVAIGALAAVFALLAPALTAGAVGLIAFGAAVLLIGAGIAIASAGIALLASRLPIIAAFGLQAAANMALLGASMFVLGAGAIVAGAGLVVLSAGLVLLAASVAIASAALLLSVVGFAALAGGALLAAAALLAVVAELKSMKSSLQSIAKNATTANKAIQSMKNGINIVQAGLSALGNKIKSVMSNAVSTFTSAGAKIAAVAMSLVSALASAAMAAGKGFASGLQAGLSAAVNVARMAVNAITNAMRTGYNGAYSAGHYIGQGLANGMRSMLGTVRSIASQLAAAANQAIAAKAKIGSPSKITTYYGEMVGQGFINGMKDKQASAAKAAGGLFEPALNMSHAELSGGNLNENFDYNTKSTVIVPVNLDGRTIAEVTAPYNQKLNDRAQAKRNRAAGYVR